MDSFPETLRERVGGVSDALEYMCAGLLKMEREKKTIVDMGSFIGRVNGVCYGCAATAAATAASGVSLGSLGSGRDIRTDYIDLLSTSCSDLTYWEDCVDLARTGMLKSLFDYSGEGDQWDPGYDNRFYLGTHGWREELPWVYDLIDELREEDL